MQEKISQLDQRTNREEEAGSAPEKIGASSAEEDPQPVILTPRGRTKRKVRRAKRPASPASPLRTKSKKRRNATPQQDGSTSGEDGPQSDNSRSSSPDQYTNSDTDYEDYDQPQITFGAIVGSTIKTKLRNKILENRYLEMAELLPDFKSKKTTEAYYIQKDANHSPRFVKPRPKYDINFGQWCEAFENFSAVHLERAKTRDSMLKLALSLMTYKRTVSDLNKKNYDWAAYDRHFRSDREQDKTTWATTKHHLMVMYQPSFRDSFRQNGSGSYQNTFRKNDYKNNNNNNNHNQ